MSTLPNSQNRLERFGIAFIWLEMLKKRFFSCTKPLKILPLDTRTEPFLTTPLSSSVEQKWISYEHK